MADTLKAQHTAYLTTGCVCYSDMGRILCSITADTCGWHDTLCGVTDAALIARALRRDALPGTAQRRFMNGRDSLLVELGKYGLGKRDLVANINFFSKVVVDDAGALHLAPGHSQPGDVRRPALRDGHAGGAARLPASARPGRGISRRADMSAAASRSAPAARRRSLPHALPENAARLRQHRKACSCMSKRELSTRTADAMPWCPAGEPWMGVVCRGQTFRIVDLEGNQAVDTLFYNAADTATSATARRTPSARRAAST